MERYQLSNEPDWTKVGAHLDQVDSTNAELWRRIREAQRSGAVLPEGSSVRADFQTAGRGRFERGWEGAAGENLTVSFYLRPEFLSVPKLFALSQTVALAVQRVVERYAGGADCKLKWPNDIIVGQRKAAGILIENNILAGRVVGAVIGVGINVNQASFTHAPSVTSLSLLAGEQLSVAGVFVSLATELHVRYEALRSLVGRADLHPLQRAYHQELFGLGEWLRFRELPTGGSFAARVLAVRADGQLVLERSDGTRSFGMDEIRYEGPLRRVET